MSDSKLYWLIERNSPAEYVVDDHYGSLEWTFDPHKALKFPDAEMANDFIKRTMLSVQEGLRVCGHVFIDRPPAKE